METIQYYAHQFVKAGIGVIPVGHRDKRPDFRLLPKDDTTNESVWEGYKTRLPENAELETWFGHGFHNYGVVMGWRNLVVLDFDEAAQYSRWMLWANRSGGIAKNVSKIAFRVRSSRGVHVYIRTNEVERNRKLKNLDIKANGYVLGPGCIHPSGAVYEPIQSAWIFPVVNCLSEVLPLDWLIEDDPLPSPPNTEQINLPEYDPWDAAVNPRVINPANDLIGAIRERFKIEMFFPDARKSGGQGRWMMTKCPFHDDSSPSFWIDTKRQICRCFTCQDKPMDVINLYARLQGLSNFEAIEMLRKRL